MPIRNRVARFEHDDPPDSDVPAAVVCAHCGDADCAGCLQERTQSGVVAVVPWERPGAPMWSRLWATARATTIDADRFFASLPDGPIAPALRFALLSEVLASAAMAVVAIASLAMVVPAWAKHMLLEQTAMTTRLLVAGIPGLAALLVAAHAAHGWALDIGARRSGSRGAPARALRFGLYATGWDIVIGPLGAVVVAFKEGARSSVALVDIAMGLPTRSARGFLRGCYRLEGKSAEPALRASYVAAVVATAVGTVAVIAAVLVVALV